ncbi:MAG: UTP--glucose-1-phosphate uridylyltransferase [Flavobacteriales bacterium]|nr:UTP--glucose-1-phosphate uridylyltransferase [Flavobacteriales bacterium]
MRVKKAVVPAAGFGTRMLPITSVVPKELLPVCGRPVIQHVVQEAVAAGITEVILVLSEGKEAVADYFRPNKKLAEQLLRTGKHAELQQLERIWDMAKITVVYQQEQLGLGHAVLCAKDAVGNEPFAVLLGDCIIQSDDCGSFTKKLVEAFGSYDRSVVGVEPVDECLIQRYGIFEGAEFEDNVFHGKRVVEKPDPSQTDSNLAFCARYVFSPALFQQLENTQHGLHNEIQLTDAMQKLLETEGLNAVKLEGERFDVGDPKGLLYANLSMMEIHCGE